MQIPREEGMSLSLLSLVISAVKSIYVVKLCKRTLCYRLRDGSARLPHRVPNYAYPHRPEQPHFQFRPRKETVNYSCVRRGKDSVLGVDSKPI